LSRVLPLTLVVEVALGAHIAPQDVGLGVGLLLIVELLIVLVKPAEGFLGAAAFGSIVRAAVELGLAIKGTARGRELLIVARDTSVLATVLAVLGVELLLLRVELPFVTLLCDGRGLRRLGGRFLGAAAFGQAAGLGPIVRIALGVALGVVLGIALGVLESDRILPALLGGRLLPVEAEEEGLLAAGLLPRRLAVRLRPR
jgi:hypothetical protein